VAKRRQPDSRGDHRRRAAAATTGAGRRAGRGFGLRSCEWLRSQGGREGIGREDIERLDLELWRRLELDRVEEEMAWHRVLQLGLYEYLMRVQSRGVIRGHHRSSEAIRGHQWVSMSTSLFSESACVLLLIESGLLT